MNKSGSNTDTYKLKSELKIKKMYTNSFNQLNLMKSDNRLKSDIRKKNLDPMN